MSPKGQHVQGGSRHRTTRAGDGSESESAADDDRSESDSSGSDEDGDYEPENEQELGNRRDIQLNDRKKIEECWEQIMEGLKDDELKKSNDAQEKFFTKHKASLGPPPDWAPKEVAIQKRNALCRLAFDGKPELPHLVKLLVEEYPQLLEDTGMSGQRAFDIALDAKLDWFIKAVVESDIKDKDLEKAMAPVKASNGQAGSKSNCVHKAITTDLDPSLTRKFIERASSDLLTAQDDAGLTPLHHAVHYKRCTKGRGRVVRALLRCGDEALDKRTPPPQSYSAYRYHVHTRPKKPLKAPADEGEGKTEQKTRGEPEQERQRLGEDKKPMPGADKGPPVTEQKKSKDEEKEKGKGKGKDKEKEKGKEASTRSGGRPQRAATFGPAPAPQANEGRLLLISAPSVSETSAPSTPKLQAQEHFPTPPSGSVTAATTRPTATANKPSGSKRSPKPSTSKADEVAKSLKLSYFRSIFKSQPGDQHTVQRNHASAEEFLYGDNKECRAICFQFPPVHRKEPEKIDFECFKESYKGFAFDPMLLYVDFGKFRREWPDDPRSAKNRLLQGPGRRDLVDFFAWLYKDKGVRNIIKISVDDEDDVPHCDDAIVASLKRFDIEILDWRKADLCPLAIQQACKRSPNLRELHLCWSGNNAILRSWSAPGGLTGLLELEQIHIYEIKPSLDSPERTQANLDNFEVHLNNARQVEWEKDDEKSELKYERVKVATHRYDDSNGYAHGVQGPLGQGTHRPKNGKKIDEHQWLDIMDTFAGAVRKVQEEELSNFPDQYLTCSKLPRELTKDVTVALIDDGVDFMHPAISKNLVPGRSFDSGFGFHDRLGSPAPFHGSTTGHGTFMAYMIQRVCPSVKIFVYKIDVLPKDKDGDAVTFTAKSAADAVEDAVKRGFDIISMSWSVQRNDSTDEALNNTAHLNRLKASLEKASNDQQDAQGKKIGKETLLFCSAPDTGESSLRDTHYPFNCDGISKIFRIGAAQVTGKAYPWTGNQVEYILPGENVGMKPSDMVRPNEDKVLRTGSSVATALAAGLAAIIIHCVRLGAVYNFHKNNRAGVSERSVRAIKTFKAMKAAFENISKSDWTKGDKRLEVETFFKNYGTELSKDAPKSEKEKEQWKEERWSNVAEIARNLLHDNVEKEFAKG